MTGLPVLECAYLVGGDGRQPHSIGSNIHDLPVVVVVPIVSVILVIHDIPTSIRIRATRRTGVQGIRSLTAISATSWLRVRPKRFET
jgi:hypothetical protein